MWHNFLSSVKKNILLLFLTGCISYPKEEQEENLIPFPTLSNSIQEASQSSLFSIGSWPAQHWWNIFHSKELDHLMQIALDNNPTLLSIEKRLEYAKQNTISAKSKLYPLLSFDTEFEWEYLSKNGLYRALNSNIRQNGYVFDLTLSFNYEFDFWGKNRNLFQAALGIEKAFEAETSQVKLITSTSLALAYFAYKTNLIRKELYEKLYQIQNSIHSLEKALYQNSLNSRLPVLFSEEVLQNVKKKLEIINQEVSNNLHLINTILGQSPDESIHLSETLSELPTTLSIPETLSLNLLSRRPDLMAQIWRVEALAHEVGAAIADYFPNINLSSFAGFETTMASLLFNPSSATFGATPSLNLPIYTAGEIAANIEGKKALFNEAVYTYNQLILQSAQEVADLLVLTRSINAQNIQQKLIVEKAQDRYSIGKRRQESGLDSALQTLMYQNELILNTLEEIRLTYEQYRMIILLIKSLGGGYCSEYEIPIKANDE